MKHASPIEPGKSRQTRQVADAAEGARIKYIQHPAVTDPATSKALIAGAERSLESEDIDRDQELQLFQALHACGYCIERSAGRRARASKLTALYHRIVDRLVRDNLGLVYEMRRRFKPGREVDSDDLMSEGIWTLYQAVTSFNPWKGFRFTTYACRSILRRFVWFSQRRRRQAEYLGELRERMESEGRADDRRDLEHEVQLERLRRVLDQNRAGLTSTERFVLERRILNPVESRPETLESVGRLIHFSRERMRQIQETAISKLRAAMAPESQEIAA